MVLRRGIQSAIVYAALQLAPSPTLAEDPAEPLSFVTEILIDEPLEPLLHKRLLSIGREELESAPQLQLDDVLRQVPGFSSFRRSSARVAHPTTQGATLRGLPPSGAGRSLVTLDGVPLHDPFGGWVRWNRVPPGLLEGVSVHQGDAPRRWSSYALSGEVALESRAPRESLREVELLSGAFDTRAASAFASHYEATLDAQLFLRTFTSDGFLLLAPEQRGPIDTHASLDTQLGQFVVRRRFSEVEMALRGSSFKEERNNGTALTYNESEEWEVAVNVHHLRSGASLQLFQRDGEFSGTFSSQAEDRRSEIPALDQRALPAQVRGAAMTLPLGGGAQLSADLTNEDGETNEDFRYMAGEYQRRRRAQGQILRSGVHLQREYGLSPLFTTELGLRIDGLHYDNLVRREFTLPSLSLEREDRTDDRWRTYASPHLALTWQLDPRTALAARVYRSVRSPTINELVRPFRVRNDITEGNLELLPERLLAVGVGGRREFDGAHLSLDLFANRIDDYVVNLTRGYGEGIVAPCGFVPAGGVCRQRENIERVVLGGVEVTGGVELSPRIALESGYLYTWAEVDTARAERALEGRRPPHQPRHQATLSLVTTAERLLGRLDLRVTSEAFEDDRNELRLSGFAMLDAQLRYRATPTAELFLTVENLLNHDVEVQRTAEGLVTLGTPRALFGGVRLLF